MDQGAGRFAGHRSRHRRPTICCTSVWSKPGDGWLSEESENDPTRLAARRVWVVDPIDGTRAFIAGREDWSVSVALVVDGRPVVAALFAPVTDELFLATVGGGATRNGVAIRASSGGSLDGARVGGPKRMLERIAFKRHRHCADAAHPFAGAAARAGGARRARRRRRRRQQPRLGPCGCRPFGARSRRHDDRARRPGSDLQPARSGAQHRCSRRAATGTRRWPISSVRRPASRCNVGRRACST